MGGSDIYLHNVMSNFIISMVKTLVYRRLELPERQQRLFYRGSDMEDNKSLAYCNMDSSSRILIVKILRGGARNKATLLQNNSHELVAVCSQNSDNISSYNSDTFEEKTATSKEKTATSKEDVTIEE